MLSIPLHVPTLAMIGALSFFGPSAHAATPTKAPGSARTIAVELVESGGKAGDQRVSFTVPIGGEIKAWVRGGDDPRFCRVHVHPADAGELHVDLECARGKTAPPDLEVEATRTFAAGRSVVLGKVARPDGRTVEVRAKL